MKFLTMAGCSIWWLLSTTSDQHTVTTFFTMRNTINHAALPPCSLHRVPTPPSSSQALPCPSACHLPGLVKMINHYQYSYKGETPDPRGYLSLAAHLAQHTVTSHPSHHEQLPMDRSVVSARCTTRTNTRTRPQDSTTTMSLRSAEDNTKKLGTYNRMTTRRTT